MKYVLLRIPVIVWVCLALAGCTVDREVAEREGQSREDSIAMEVARLDTTTYTDMGGAGGTLLLGEGWHPEEGHGGDGPWGNFSWSRQEARIYFTAPDEPAVDLLFHCHPLAYDGSPEQTVTVIMGGREVATETLPRGWGLVRIPLTFGFVTEGINEAVLQFAYSARPSDVLGTADARNLAAACTELAVVPRWLENPLHVTKSAGVESEARQIVLPPGFQMSLPLPAFTEVEVRLRQSTGCMDCIVTISRASGEGVEELWRGPVRDVEDANIEVAGGLAGQAELQIRHQRRPDQTRGVPTVHLALPEPFLITKGEKIRPSGPPNVFTYMVDTLRADATEPYGAPAGRTPNLRRFAADSVTYLGATSPSSWTLPSIVSLLTGVYPARHGIMQGARSFGTDNYPSLAGRLSDEGWQALGISQSFIASSAFGIDTGFDTFFLNDRLSQRWLRTEQVRRYLLEWLTVRESPSQPLFTYIHTVGPHAPYTPPPRFRELAAENPGSLPESEYHPVAFMLKDYSEDPQEVAHLKSLYLGEVGYEDEQFGRFVDLLKYLGLYDTSFVIFLSDHGEEFNEHGGFDHGRTLYGEQLRVPLMVKFPEAEFGGERIETRVSTVDLVPTLLRYLDLPEDDLDGSSLQPPDLADDLAAARVVFSEVNPKPSEHLAEVDLRTLIRRNLKCIENLKQQDRYGQPAPQWEVFDVQQDPMEQRPLSPGSVGRERCEQMMKAFTGRLAEKAQAQFEEDDPVSDETVQKLRALGYIR